MKSMTRLVLALALGLTWTHAASALADDRDNRDESAEDARADSNETEDARRDDEERIPPIVCDDPEDDESRNRQDDQDDQDDQDARGPGIPDEDIDRCLDQEQI
jgi:hypothetical protein